MVRSDALPDEVAAHGLAVGELEEGRVPALDLHLGEEALQHPRRQVGVDGQRTVGERVRELGRVAARSLRVSADAMTVTRVAGPYRRVRQFMRERIEHLRMEAYPGLLRGMFGSQRDVWRHAMEMWGLGGGSIAFVYGARTHRFGSKLDEAESRQLVELLRLELGLADRAQ